MKHHRFMPSISLRRLLFYASITVTTFIFGIVAVRIYVKRGIPQRVASNTVNVDQEAERPLTVERVSRSLQTHSFRTSSLRRNSNDEVVWRWLKAEIGSYPQNWVKLEIKDTETYGVVLNPQQILGSEELKYYNSQLKQKVLPLLETGKRYLPVDVYRGNTICPSWSGLIDVERSKLVYFEGESG